MSVYRRTDRVPLDDVTTVTGSCPPGAKSQDDGDFSKRRTSEPANGLLRTTVNWASRLRPDARPNALLAKFPRIGNLLAVLWADPNSWRRYIDDLLVDKRGDRQGFPLEILRELFALRDYYDELHPPASRPWEVMKNNE